MIPRANIVEWRGHAPWKSDAQVEQDLVLSRLIVSIFLNPLLATELLFRGGTALHKLFLAPATRYSEDLDFVQKRASPIGPVLTSIRSIVNPLFGSPRIRQKEESVILTFRLNSEIPPIVPLRIKIEVNTREHFHAYPTINKPFSVKSRWFTGESSVQTYILEELLGTKLRALYQRRKGRDLFDLWRGLTEGKADPRKIVTVFQRYLAAGGLRVSRTSMQRNLADKLRDTAFMSDLGSLLRPDIVYSPQEAFAMIDEMLISLFE